MGNCNSNAQSAFNNRCSNRKRTKRNQQQQNSSSSSSSSSSPNSTSNSPKRSPEARSLPNSANNSIIKQQNRKKSATAELVHPELATGGETMMSYNDDNNGPEVGKQQNLMSKQQDRDKNTEIHTDADSMAAKESATRLEKLKEGLDFIETEEDVKAVESAALKIQSTFRGKKIRSKITPKDPPPEVAKKTTTRTSSDESTANKSSEATRKSTQPTTIVSAKTTQAETEAGEQLSKRVAAMQVNDNNSSGGGGGGGASSNGAKQATSGVAATNPTGTGLPEEEAQRAATKIQAGFKGYKTRKELEGKIPTGSASSQQVAPTASESTKS